MPGKSDPSESWRKPSGAAPKRRDRVKNWEQREPDEARRIARRNLRRKLLAFVLVGLALGMGGVALWILLTRDVPTPLVAWAVTEYADPVPVNGWAQEDLQAFGQLWTPSLKKWQLGGLAGTSLNLAMTNLSEFWSRPLWQESLA